MKTLAPILLFTYNRLDYLKQTLEALKKNILAKESDLFVFSDGWKDEFDRKKVEEVRVLLHSITGFKSIEIIENKTNKKLAPNLIAGISKIFDTFDKIIVFEDDIVCSELTLEFLNDALEVYKEDTNVGMIHAQVETIPNLPELFFIQRSGCLAWAMWKRAWNEINFDGTYLLSEIIRQKREKEFNQNNSYRYIQMLKKQIAGKNSSWAIRVYASFFLKNILTLYPGNSYAQHIGFEQGTNCGYATQGTDVDGHITAIANVAKRIPIHIDEITEEKIERFYKLQKRWTSKFIFNEVLKRWRRLLSFISHP